MRYMSTTNTVNVVSRANTIARTVTVPKLLVIRKGEDIRAANQETVVRPEAMRAEPMRREVTIRASIGSPMRPSSS